jgi:hypothetical protein
VGRLAEAQLRVASDWVTATVREAGLARELVDKKVCAIDANWSALRFVVRVADRTRAENRADLG